MCQISLSLLTVSFCLSVFHTAHTQPPSEGKPIVRQPGGDSAYVNPSKPPSVKVIGGSASGSWARTWSLVLLFATLCLQGTLFWSPPALPAPEEPHAIKRTPISYTYHLSYPHSCPLTTDGRTAGDDGKHSVETKRRRGRGWCYPWLWTQERGRGGTFAGTPRPAASPTWAFAHANPMHVLCKD